MKAMPLTRKRAARAVSIAMASAVAIAALAGCSAASNGSSGDGGSDGGVTKISFWGSVPGLEDLVDQWNKDNPDIQVDFHRMTGEDSQKVEAAVDAGAGPDLVQLSTHSIPDYLIAGRVQDVTKYAEQYKDNYTDIAWNAVTVGGKVYGLPGDIGPTATLYREDLFTKFNVPVPKTWDEYLAAARTIHAADPSVFIANLSPTESGQWEQEVHQADGSWYQVDGDAWKVTVNSPESKLVAARWQTLLDEGLVTTETMWTPEYWAKVNAGQIATISYGAWFPVLMKDNAESTSGLWRVTPMPTNAGSDHTGDLGGAANVVLKGAKNPEAATKFAAWITGAPEIQDTLIKVGGLFPSTKSGIESPELSAPQDFFGGQKVGDVFIDASKTSSTAWVDGPNYKAVQTAIGDEFSKVIAGGETFSQALDNAQKAAVADLKSRGLNVEE
jgi:multiple sugar transport system substrate-binding protein